MGTQHRSLVLLSVLAGLAASSRSTPRSVPAPISVPSFAAVSAGGSHTCGVTAAGAVYCWGANASGQLGDGTMAQRSSPTRVAAPVGVGFAATSVGQFHTCGVTAAGAVYCWGDNFYGQLGAAASTARSTPGLVAVPANVRFAAVSAGDLYACAVTGAGAAYCWGRNYDGQLGDGTATNRSAPRLVAVPAGARFAAVSAGYFHTCGVTAAGAAYCWGDNDDGQLGDGTSAARSRPTLVVAPRGVRFAAVSAGHHTCGVTAAGAAYCWGRNDDGQVGDGTKINRSAPTRVAAPADTWFTAVSAGYGHSCGVTAAGAAYCWGRNDDGQLGDGTTTHRSTAVPVAAPAGVRFAAVSAGRGHTCAVTADGAAYCWGRNDDGRLGDGTLIQRLRPARVE